jgi:hypothetical protein
MRMEEKFALVIKMCRAAELVHEVQRNLGPEFQEALQTIYDSIADMADQIEGVVDNYSNS